LSFSKKFSHICLWIHNTNQIWGNKFFHVTFLVISIIEASMNIILISQFFSTTRGGGEYLFHIIANMLVKNGHKVWVITNKIKNEEYLEAENLRIITIKPELEYKGGLPPSFLDNIKFVFMAIREARKIFKHEQIDLIHSNNFSPALAGSILSTITKTIHITTIFDIFSNTEKDFWRKWSKQTNVSKINAMLVPIFEKLLIMLKHEAFHTISEATKNDIIEIGSSKSIYVIPPTINKIIPRNSKSNSFQFIYVGRLVFYKNLETIIKAIKLVSETNSKIKLIIVGDGPHRETLENIVKKLDLQKNIEFAGYVSAENKIKLISESIALLFPSMYEGFGLVILEAFSQKKPVIVSNIRPMSDIVKHEETGYVLEPHDEKMWAQYIMRIIEKPEEGKILGENGKKLFETKYTQDLMYEKLIKMYETVIQNTINK